MCQTLHSCPISGFKSPYQYFEVESADKSNFTKFISEE